MKRWTFHSRDGHLRSKTKSFEANLQIHIFHKFVGLLAIVVVEVATYFHIRHVSSICGSQTSTHTNTRTDLSQVDVDVLLLIIAMVKESCNLNKQRREKGSEKEYEREWDRERGAE